MIFNINEFNININFLKHSMTSKTICVAQEGPANALALNKDNNQVVIAGRNGASLH